MTDNVDQVFERSFQELSEAVLIQTINWNLWVHRRIDVFRPASGARGNMRSSLDCTPPRTGTSLHGTQIMPGLGTKAEPTSIVPLALFKKDPLRGFSARFDDG
ncbi:hypothetical protein ACFSYH_01445 [Populibacterium corticicola]|uniref:Uncharacterized protein n=1 Tax=Populibacterium corticicola TaxID=1812826 RepID=A0ABW5XEG6_9MICO